jgi:hypothetical protein
MTVEVRGNSGFAAEAVVKDFAVVSIVAGFLLLPDALCESRVESCPTVEDDGRFAFGPKEISKGDTCRVFLTFVRGRSDHRVVYEVDLFIPFTS